MMTKQVRGAFRIGNPNGLHTRPATRVAKLAAGFGAMVTVENHRGQAHADSVLELLMLCGEPGSELRVTAVGVDAEVAVAAIGALIEDRSGDEG